MIEWRQYFPTLHPLTRRLVAWYLRRDTFERAAITVVACSGVVAVLFGAFFAPVPGYVSGTYVKVEEGMPVQEITRVLHERGVVRSAYTLKMLIKLFGDERHIPAGEYYFSRRENLIWVAQRLSAGDFQTTAVRVTILEGATVAQISKLLTEKVPEFDRRQFVAHAREGRLFPDTYFFTPGQSAEAILSVFDNNFRLKMLKVQGLVTASRRSQEDLLIMASLLEKEAAKMEDRRMIAGILWRRIAIGMPLQVDATFPYYLGRNTYEVTRTDLRTDHPYNTYTNKGLPPGPIGNPGLGAIEAAATPRSSPYLFYLSDRNGTFHYATTYEQHLVNRQKYIEP